MKYDDLVKRAGDLVHPVRIDKSISDTSRIRILQSFSLSVIAGLILSAIALFTPFGWFFQFLGFSIFLMGCWLIVFAVVSYAFSSAVQADIKKKPVSFEVATILLTGDSYDLTAGFLSTSAGRMVFFRLGLNLEDRQTFYKERTKTIVSLEVPDNLNHVDLGEYTQALVQADHDLREFLRSRRITEDIVFKTAKWVQQEFIDRRQSYRWWSIERLRKIPGIGSSWHFGETPALDRYSTSAVQFRVVRMGAYDYYKNEADSIEVSLSRSRQANALLVGQVGSGLREIISVFASRVEEGSVAPELERSRVRILDANLMVVSSGGTEDVKKILINVLEEAIRAEGVILVIENIVSFLRSLEEVGINGTDMMEPYLKDGRVHVIATTSPHFFHSDIEQNERLKKWFEKIDIERSEEEQTIRLLENQALKYESKFHGNVFITYPAIEAVYKDSKRYITNAVMPSAALNLMDEAFSVAGHANKPIITKSFIDRIVNDKTGISVGDTSREEQQKLLDLENILHRRIVGQNEAVQAVSDALLRSRSGIADPNRPLGVFLFMGPTGVGKTEMAKVLADTMFDGRDNMVRIDMSEFSGGDALSKLIGSKKNNQSGTLAVLARDNPYSVLLLDEFEKAGRDVHDLFLQIFDEGVFHDADGREVNMRNMIIIATSNAASRSIRSTIAEGRQLDEKRKEEIVDKLIETGSFRPELINRFDRVVMFKPLTESEAKDVAELELAKLQARLNDRGITFEVTEPLLDYLVENGYDENFGARSIRRIIDSDIEKIVSHKLVTGEIKPGDTVVITEKDLTSLS